MMIKGLKLHNPLK